MRLFNLKNTKEEKILPELALYWTGNTPLLPGASRVFSTLNGALHMNLITPHLLNKSKLYWYPLECAKNIKILRICQDTTAAQRWGDGPLCSFVLRFTSGPHTTLRVIHHSSFSSWHSYLSWSKGHLSGLALYLKRQTHTHL